MRNRVFKRTTKSLGGAFRSVLMLALLLPLAVTAPTRNASAGVQPQLLAMAAQNPDATVQVIVQKSARDGSVERAIAGLGGTVTNDLSIINAVGVQMSAGAAGRLAEMPGVRWISLDAPVQSAAVGFTTWATDISVNNTSSVSNTFNATPIYPKSYLWVNSVLKVSGLGATPVTINFDNVNVGVSSNGVSFNMPVPAASIVYSPTATTASTIYDAVNGQWVTTVPSKLGASNVFLTGLAEQIPIYLPGNIGPLTMSGRFTTDTPGVTVSGWTWGASVYSNFSSDYSKLGVKPYDDGALGSTTGTDKAATPANFKAYSIAGATGRGGADDTGAYGTPSASAPALTFNDTGNMVDAPKGPNSTFGYGGNVSGSFAGFSREQQPGTKIAKVEAVVKAYVPTGLSGTDSVLLTVATGGQAVKSANISQATLNTYYGPANAGLIYMDMTGGRNWLWSDFNNGLNLTITQSGFAPGHAVYYDAVGLRITAATGSDPSGGTSATSLTKNLIDPYKLGNVYNSVVRASNVWDQGPDYYQGQGTTVAVVDSGVGANKDLGTRLVNGVNFNKEYHDSVDSYGHGTFVAGLVAGDGSLSSGKYVGIAPKTNILNVRVSNDQGGATESEVVSALQWVNDNKVAFNIRVVNMSLNSASAQSYLTSPMDAAAEILWFNGIVVVASAGNTGTANLYPPANDPFVITVGATDDKGTLSTGDDVRAGYSSYGTTDARTSKPDIVAPGTRIIGLLPQNGVLKIGEDHPSNSVNLNYFSLSGTSMAAPMVSGAAALMLQANPALNPDQVKNRLMSTANKNWPGYDTTPAASTGAGYLDIYAAMRSTSMDAAPSNLGKSASQLLQSGSAPITWGSVNWNSVNWNSVNWNSVNWNSVNWNSVNWNSDYWGQP